MYKVGDRIIYKKDVCKIIDIKNNKDGKAYYILVPVNDDSLTISIPITNSNIRSLITKDEVESIINNIPNIEIITSPDKLIEYEYKDLMSSGKHEDLIKIIKTTYLRNENRINNNKKTGDKDSAYFNQAEKYLYTEFSEVLNMSYEETKKYVNDKVSELEK